MSDANDTAATIAQLMESNRSLHSDRAVLVERIQRLEKAVQAGKEGVMLIPEDCRYPGAMRARVTNHMKAVEIGEYSFQRQAGRALETIVVPWDTCKDIYKGMAKTAAVEYQQKLSHGKLLEPGK